MENLDRFRADIAKWLDENCPASMRGPMTSEDEANWGGRRKKYGNPDEKLWLDRMAARGFTCPTWPREYGGGGLSNAEARILADEMRKIRARPPLISLIGATETPGVSMSNSRKLIPSCLGAFVSVRTRQKIQSA